MATIEIQKREIGHGRPCFFVAEAGVNHNGDLRLAKRLVETAAEAGADAVKFQTFTAEKVATAFARTADYQRDRGEGEGQIAMLKRLELSAEAHRELKGHCEKCRIVFMSTPFDEDSVALLETLDVPVFKLASGEVTNWPFLDFVARRKRPIILSTGMSTLEEVSKAVGVINQGGNDRIILLHCVSSYPAIPADVNLRAMSAMETAFGVPVGFSDHTLGIEVSLAAVALGACIIEKHFTLDRGLPGPDHQASLEPDELHALVRGIRTVEAALGNGRKEPAASEHAVALIARRSLVAARDIAAGTRVTADLLAARRPGTGLTPSALASVLGRVFKVDVPVGGILTEDLLE